jgi:hypothetical protein
MWTAVKLAGLFAGPGRRDQPALPASFALLAKNMAISASVNSGLGPDRGIADRPAEVYLNLLRRSPDFSTAAGQIAECHGQGQRFLDHRGLLGDPNVTWRA